MALMALEMCEISSFPVAARSRSNLPLPISLVARVRCWRSRRTPTTDQMLETSATRAPVVNRTAAKPFARWRMRLVASVCWSHFLISCSLT